MAWYRDLLIITRGHLVDTGGADPTLLRRLEAVYDRFHLLRSNREVFDAMCAARPWVQDGTEIAGWLDAAISDLADRLAARILSLDGWHPPERG